MHSDLKNPPPPFSAESATATAMAGAIRAKQISATELLDITLRRIDRQNPALNAIVWECREQAMARARQADAAHASGQATGPLHGVPVTIKESFAYQGSPNTWGLPPLKDAMSPRTAVAVERLESAGAIVVGKTNVPVMLGDWQSYNPIYGTTNNPWDLTRTPGGSTGGGAAAVAAGLGALTIGSDLSGSIRIPAHFCGVFGHKPSLDLVGTTGFQPGPWDGSPEHTHGAGDRCISFRYTADFFASLAADVGARASTSPFRLLRLPPLRALSRLVGLSCAGLGGSASRSWDELSVQVAARTVTIASSLSGRVSDLTHEAVGRVARVVRAIERHPDGRLPLDRLARSAGLSPYHFLRTFERVTGVTPHQYVLRTRLREAATRLTADPSKVLDVALDCGFGDVSNFNRAFRAEFGVTPRGFRAGA